MSYQHLADVEHTVYRLYDTSGRLIYVGCTYDLDARLKTHRRNMWWYYQIARTVTEKHSNRTEALSAETRIRDTEHPRWNIESRWAHRHSFTEQMFADYITAMENHPSRKYASIRRRLEKATKEYRKRFGTNQQQQAA